MKNFILFAALATIFVSCQLQDPNKEKNELPANVHEAKVKEVIQATNYTYMLIDVENRELWLAGPKTEASEGDIFYFKESMKMKDFESKELKRKFDQILFVEKLSKDPNDFEKKKPAHANYQADIKTTKENISIELGDGITSISKLFENKNEYNGKTITVKGIVTKYNAGIMNKNWIHIQDGTENGGKFDLTATSAGILCNVGDTLTLEGKVSLDKDFGYGYKYEVLLEDAVSK